MKILGSSQTVWWGQWPVIQSIYLWWGQELHEQDKTTEGKLHIYNCGFSQSLLTQIGWWLMLKILDQFRTLLNFYCFRWNTEPHSREAKWCPRELSRDLLCHPCVKGQILRGWNEACTLPMDIWGWGKIPWATFFIYIPTIKCNHELLTLIWFWMME